MEWLQDAQALRARNKAAATPACLIQRLDGPQFVWISVFRLYGPVVRLEVFREGDREVLQLITNATELGARLAKPSWGSASSVGPKLPSEDQ